MASELNKRGIKNQIVGNAKEVEGKARRKIARMSGNKTEERRGIAKELEGKVQKALGAAQRKIADED